MTPLQNIATVCELKKKRTSLARTQTNSVRHDTHTEKLSLMVVRNENYENRPPFP